MKVDTATPNSIWLHPLPLKSTELDSEIYELSLTYKLEESMHGIEIYN